MAKIKVAFFADILIKDHDGAVRTMYQLINRIDERAFEYLFIFGKGPGMVAGFDTFKVPSVIVPLNMNYAIALPWLAKHQLIEKLNGFSPQVVHIATPSLLGHFGLQYAADRHIPVITIYHTHFISYIDYYFKHTPFLIKAAKRTLIDNHRAFYNRCDMVYVPSDSIKAELATIGIAPGKMKIWKRGIDNRLFSPAKRNLKLMQQLTGNTNPVVLFASRLVWEKNLETLFEIYMRLKASRPNVNFLVVGDGSALKACRLKMKDALFMGSVNHTYLSVLYASADAFLFPSVSETYGNVVLEAMASGLPCVIADGGGSKDFIEQGANGFKCEPYNAADYVEKIELLLSDQLLADQFSAAGLNYSQQLRWGILAKIYFDEVYRMVQKPIALTFATDQLLQVAQC